MLELNQGEVFIPDGKVIEKALARTTHLAIAAHQDDIEIMAISGILHCFNTQDQWFSGVVMTDGRSSPRSGSYVKISDDEMVQVRNEEQKRAAVIGAYSAQILLGYKSAEVKNKNTRGPVEDLLSIFQTAKARTVYLHNLADKHPTHVATVLRSIEALRLLDEKSRPESVFGCEVWRGLVWILDKSKVSFNCSEDIELQESLLSVFVSQNMGGKRYDLATMGRRLSNATYFEVRNTDQATHVAFAMDLTPLIDDPALDIDDFIWGYIEQFGKEVQDVIKSLH